MNKSIIVIIIVVLLVGGAIAYSQMGNNAEASINNFDECVAAGNPMMKSYPAKCTTKDGRTFVQEIETDETQSGGREIGAGVAARMELAKTLSIDESKIRMVSVTEQEWSDGCLGLGRADEGCIFMLTPGYQVVMEAEGKTYTYRTNADGSDVRLETK